MRYIDRQSSASGQRREAGCGWKWTVRGKPSMVFIVPTDRYSSCIRTFHGWTVHKMQHVLALYFWLRFWQRFSGSVSVLQPAQDSTAKVKANNVAMKSCAQH